MKHRTCFGWKHLLPLSVGLLTVLFHSALNHSKLLRGAQMKRANGNPDQFHLWARGGSYDFAFTYDPLAADNWLFDSAAAAKNQVPVLLPPARIFPGSNMLLYDLLSQPANQ